MLEGMMPMGYMSSPEGTEYNEDYGKDNLTIIDCGGYTKGTCEEFKELRRKVVRENGLDVIIRDCPFPDESCIEPCSACEAEKEEILRQLRAKGIC